MKKMNSSAWMYALGILLVILPGCGGSDQEVKIGNQIWSTKNLDVSAFRNGDPIQEAKSFDEWRKATQAEKPVFCYLDFNPQNGEKFGKLYNFFAVNDPRGLAPEGWHIPTVEEWKMLTNYPAEELKAESGWDASDGSIWNGTNKLKFAALPSGSINLAKWTGSRYVSGVDNFQAVIGATLFTEIGRIFVNGGAASWWCAGEDVWTMYLHFNRDKLGGPAGDFAESGHAVRCIRN